MKMQIGMKVLAVALVGAIALAGCETTGQSAGLGALIGGAAGGVIGHQSGHALEGAAIGAALGAVAGAVIGDIRQRQIASRQQVVAEYNEAGVAPPTEPVAAVETLDAAPDTVQYGEKVQVNGQYTVLNVPPGQQANGVLTLYKDGQKIHEEPVQVTQEGRHSLATQLNTPEDLYPGTYVVRVDMQNGNSTASRETAFTLQEA